MPKKSSTLNEQQKAATEAPNSPLLIVAGAGTGKTSTLTSRIGYFIKKGMPPGKICAITFTNKAAREMADRTGLNIGRGTTGTEPFIGTFHSFGARILRQEANLLNRTPNFTIFDDHDSFDLIKKIARRLVPKKKSEERDGEAKKDSREMPAFFKRQISAAKNKNSFIGELKKSSHEKNRLAFRAYELYEEDLIRNNAFDFDDLIEKVVWLFKKHPEVLNKYQKRFDAVLVDEYQDMNPKQYELIKLLAGSHKNLSVVGDDEQLIYGWRYADMEIFQNFEKDWPDAQITFLEENYRSTSNIISAAAEVSKNNANRRPKNLWTRNPAGEPIKIFEAGDENEEAEWIAKNIKEPEGGTTAVLYRTNAQSRAIEQALIRRQIPYKIFGGLKFYERKEIKDIVAALRWAMNKSDEPSRERLEKLLSQRKFADLQEGFAAAQSSAPLDLIGIFLKATDYFEYLENNFLNPEERRENIAELIGFAAGFDNLQQFLEEIALVQQTDMGKSVTETENSRGGDSQPEVHLSTIHLAKGLEFDRVFIAGSSEGLLPHIMSYEDEDQMEEERRLMYVAMTRAKKKLFLSFFGAPSRFLSEIPQELLELESESFSPTEDDISVSWD
ncbi:MAG: UvrD-helicase domain-containing protein [Patescibacteria group bacterium]|nr:UvrD-helicase domain-containing protein [Patescibacteria group bacterium]MDE2015165.1 UvrD-helicase domain-containing protein [Patescibacteria group bacterium]MDE2226593.1 UvrD-helicase domain-containing protein [Patescibacteria group bacterium]